MKQTISRAFASSALALLCQLTGSPLALAADELTPAVVRFDISRFDVVGTGQLILCQDGRERSASGNCATGAPLEFIEHGRPATANTIEVDWTPPAAATAGNVRFYVAANAANGDGRNTGDRIYTANYTMTIGSQRPAITPTNGVTNGASFSPGVVSGSWTTIFGTNLAAATKDWTRGFDMSRGRRLL